MLDNYYKTSDGVIHQKIIHNLMKYDETYVLKRYANIPQTLSEMSHLRLGYILGVLKHIPESLLDVGYGYGIFLSTAKKIIPNCFGNDITGLDIPENCSFVDNIYDNFYEIITFFDVLEHFVDINKISDLKCKYIALSVPECHYFSDDWFFNWKHRREDEHLHHFNKNSLKNFMQDLGYELLDFSNIEDIIRKPSEPYSNILTGVFRKI